MLLSRSRKVLLLCLALLVIAGGAAGYVFLKLTAIPGIELSQDPNPVEAYEANRKLRLFTNALEQERRGFVRLSEVEINSFIEEHLLTNRFEGENLSLVRTSVLLSSTNLTVVAWLEKPVFGFTLPIIWRRTIDLVPGQDGVQFDLEGMQVGRLEIPPNWWPRADQFLGALDGFFQQRLEWIQSIPSLQIAKNELSNSPELRLYTFVPQDSTTK